MVATMAGDFLANALVTLFVIIEPVALVPLFLGLTGGFTPAQRAQVAWRAALIAFMVLSACAFFGDWLLGKLGITLPAFRIAGGLLLFWIGFEMVFGLRADRKERQVPNGMVDREHIVRVAAFPIAIPLLAGPGAITATLLIAGQAGGHPWLMAGLVGVLAAVLLASWAFLRLAEPVNRLIGTLGNVVISRLLGILLAALAVQFVIDGAKAVLRG